MVKIVGKVLYRLAPFLWLGTVLGLLAFLYQRDFGRGALETDILTLLPPTSHSRIVVKALDTLTAKLGDRLVVAVEADDYLSAKGTADVVVKKIDQSGLLQPTAVPSSENLGAAFEQLYFDHREGFLGPNIKALVREGDLDGLVTRVESILASPVSGGLTSKLGLDPLLIYSDLLQSWQSLSLGLSIRDGYLVSPPRQGKSSWQIVLIYQLQKSSFDRDYQQAVAKLLSAVAKPHFDPPTTAPTTTPTTTPITTASSPSGTQISSMGLIRYAERAATTAEQEISLIGTGSIAVALILVLLPFRSLSPLLLTALTVATGVIAAFSASLAVFDRVHMITLGFGASLIGVGVDHSFHFFAHQSYGQQSYDHESSGKRVIASIFPGLLLGILTTILGFLGLFISPFPGLSQIGFFSIVGLSAAFLTVVLWFPYLSKLHPKPRSSLLVRLSARWLSLWEKRSPVAIVITASLSFIAVVFGTRPIINDDVRLLEKIDPALYAEELKVRAALGNTESGRAFVVVGKDIEELLEREARLTERLQLQVAGGTLQGFQAISKLYLPSSLQQANFSDFCGFVRSKRTALNQSLLDFGFNPEDIDSFFARCSSAYQPLSFERWLKSPAAETLRDLYLGEIEGLEASLITVSGISDEKKVESEANSTDVYYISRVRDASNLMKEQRAHAALWIPLFYGFVLVVLITRYGLKRGLLAFFPALTAAFLCVAVSSLLGYPTNLFSLLSIIVVLGLGIDFTIFLLEGEDEIDATMIAVALSSLSTLSSLALLALCSSPVLKIFGINLLVGTGAALLLAPIVVYGRARQGGVQR